MTTFDPNRPDNMPGMEIGEVVDRDDPEKLGRVRVRIPGVIEPRSAWAWPLGTGRRGARGVRRGRFVVPELGAEVAVWFKGGDPDQPWYLPAQFGKPGGTSEVPGLDDVGAEGQGHPDVYVDETPGFVIVIDDRPESKRLILRDKESGDQIEIDSVGRAINIIATASIAIRSTGQVSIEGLVVTVNGVPAGFGRL